MIRNQEKVEVIEEKSITIKGKEGKVDTVIYLETDQVGLPRPIRMVVYFQTGTMI